MLAKMSVDPKFDDDTYAYFTALYPHNDGADNEALPLSGGRLLSDAPRDCFDRFPPAFAKLGNIKLKAISANFKLPQPIADLDKRGEMIYKFHEQEYHIFFSVLTKLAQQILNNIDRQLRDKPSLILNALQKFLRERNIALDPQQCIALLRNSLFYHLCSSYLPIKMYLSPSSRRRAAFNGLYLCATQLYQNLTTKTNAFLPILALLSTTALSCEGEFSESPYFKERLSSTEKRTLLGIRATLPHNEQFHFDKHFVQMMTAVGKDQPIDILPFIEKLNLLEHQRLNLYQQMLKQHQPSLITTGVLLSLHRSLQKQQGSFYNRDYLASLTNEYRKKGALLSSNQTQINYIAYLYLLDSLIKTSQEKGDRIYQSDLDLLWSLSTGKNTSHAFFNAFNDSKILPSHLCLQSCDV